MYQKSKRIFDSPAHRTRTSWVWGFLQRKQFRESLGPYVTKQMFSNSERTEQTPIFRVG